MTGPTIARIGWDEADQRLDRWLRRRYGQLAQSHIERLCRKGQIRIDGKRARPSTRLVEGQSLRLPPMEDAPGRDMTGHESAPGSGDGGLIAGRVLFQDDYMVVIDKPSGLAVQGGTGQRRHVDRMVDDLGLSDGERPRLVHRLDKDTSGVLVLARSRRASGALARLFATGSLHKIYWAVVAGCPAEHGGIISGTAGPSGKPARTGYMVLDTVADRFALVALNPRTGRTHQLRVHMAQLGTPILGDRKYGAGGNSRLPAGGVGNRLHLHARELSFSHPFTGFDMRFRAPLPAHMDRTLALLGWQEDRYPADPFAGRP